MCRLPVVFGQSIEDMCLVENEDVVGAAPTCETPTASEWSTILLSTKVRRLLEFDGIIKLQHNIKCIYNQIAAKY